MSNSVDSSRGTQTPDDSRHVTVGNRAGQAGGLGAIWSTLHEIRRNDTGLVRGAQTLLKLNQPEGVDCPGCAWAESPTSAVRSSLRKRCQSDYVGNHATTGGCRLWANHSIAALQQHSDYELGQHVDAWRCRCICRRVERTISRLRGTRRTS